MAMTPFVTRAAAPAPLAPVRSQRFVRAAKGALVAVALLTVLMALAHLPAARGARAWAMRKLGGGDACPFGASTDVAALEKTRIAGVSVLKGTGVAPSRALLGVAVGTTTRAELQQWQTEQRLDCKDESGGALVRCVRVPARAFASGLDRGVTSIDDLVFRVDPEKRIVAVDAIVNGLSAPDAIDVLERSRETLDARLQRPAEIAGPLVPSTLAGGIMRRAALSYRFSDWALDYSATTTDDRGGVTLRWQSRWLR